MNIVSYHESFNDFSDRACIVVFTQHCTWNCLNCQNKNRLLKEPVVNTNKLMKYLQESLPLINAVTISGGEPTLEEDLVDFVKDLRILGFQIRLDTNGINPRILFRVLPFLNEVAMDIKEDPSDFNKYKRVCRVITKKEFNNVMQSIHLLSDWASDDSRVIFRTTLFDNLIDINVIKEFLADYNYTQYIVQPLSFVGKNIGKISTSKN